MAFRTRLLGLDDDLLDNLPSVAATTDAMGRAVDAGMGAAVAPPTPIDPWEDEPAQTAPGLSLHLSRPMQAPSRSLLGMDFEIPEPVSKRFETAGEARPRMTTAPLTLAPIPRRLAAPTGAVEAAPELLSMMSAADDAVAEPVPEAVGRGARMVAPVAYESLEGLDDSAQPEAAPQNKGLAGITGFDPFGTTADESKALERAGTFDRRMGIARGAMQLLGGLGGIVGGATGVHGIGAAGQGLSAGGSAPIDSMRDTVQGRITQRQAQDMRRMQYGQAQEDREAQQLRQQTQDDFRRQELEATVGLRQAQTEQAQLRSRQMQDEWSQIRGNRAAGIEWLRTLASQYPNAPLAQNILSGTVEGAPLANASLEQLDRYAAQFTNMANAGQVAGRAGIGQAPGGGGGGSPLPDADPVRVANGGLEIPADVTGPERDIYVDAVNRGLDDPMNAVLTYRGSPAAGRTALWQAAIGRNEGRQSGRFVLGEGLDPRQFANISQDLDSARGAYSQFGNVSRSISSMVRRYGENQVRLALQGDPRVAQVMGSEIGQLRGAVTRAVAEYRRAMTGSAASEQEDARIMSSLSMGSIANSPSATAAALMGTGQEMMNRALRSAPPDYVSEWQRRNREALEARRTRR